MTKKPKVPRVEVAKSTVRVLASGFVERKRKPRNTGKKTKSRLVRIDADFAEWLRREAMRGVRGKSITQVTRSLYQLLSAEG